MSTDRIAPERIFTQVVTPCPEWTYPGAGLGGKEILSGQARREPFLISTAPQDLQ